MTINRAAAIAIILSSAISQVTQPPPVSEMPLSVTSFWFFDADGNPVAWQGQANGDPYHYANTEPTSADHAGKVAACIQEWTTFGWTTAVTFMWYGEQMTVACYDNFGAESYRQPFYHEFQYSLLNLWVSYHLTRLPFATNENVSVFSVESLG